MRLSLNKYINFLMTKKCNHPRFLSLLFSLVLSVVILSCSKQNDESNLASKIKPDGLSLKKVVIALKANKNPEKMLAEKEALEKYLSLKLDREVEVLIPTDSSVVVESFRNGTLDLGYLSSTDAARNLDQKTASILLIHLKNGSPSYQSVWLSLKNKNLILGTWQGIFLIEHRKQNKIRDVMFHFLGE